jgi:diguanylate cyclase (GGDEF)-like protein
MLNLRCRFETAVASNEHVKGLSELSRFLQSCADMDEAAGLLKQHLPPLMRANSGALYLMAASEYQLCQVLTWGDDTYTEIFEPHDCWAVRLGQAFHQPQEAGSASCAHLQSEHVDASANVQCLPLVAHGELMGVLVLDAYVERDQHANLEIDGTRRFALEQVSLSIGNLKLRESLRQQSIRDVLTGLYNRRFFEESSQREVLRASRLQAQGGYDGLALMMIDIDHFKRFNDLHGHETGDQVLREVAQVLQAQTRGSDVAARFGGEEFTILMADITAEQALEHAQRVRQEVEKLVLRCSGKDVGIVTISIGLAQFPVHGSTVEALLLAADKALYEAKHAGRNRVVVAT